MLRIDWAGDVGQLRVDGRPATDRFWDGSSGRSACATPAYRPGSEVTLHLLPLAAGSTVAPAAGTPATAWLAADGQLLAIDGMRVETQAVRRETHLVRRTARRMSDGRDIIYFDDTPPFVSREAVDTRELPPATAGPQMRYDPLTGEWIAVAAHRNDRTFRPAPTRTRWRRPGPAGSPPR